MIVALGGDGFMLHTLHRTMNSGKLVYGMNRGSIGFLMNRLQHRKPQRAHRRRRRKRLPSAGDADDRRRTDNRFKALAINEVYLFRQSYQAAKLRVVVDGRVRLEELICDGVLLSTPAGSTAYNLSAHGPILPLEAPLLALTPVSPFRPRRWRGALLPNRVTVDIDILEANKRPVNAVADHVEVKSVVKVTIGQSADRDGAHPVGPGLFLVRPHSCRTILRLKRQPKPDRFHRKNVQRFIAPAYCITPSLDLNRFKGRIMQHIKVLQRPCAPEMTRGALDGPRAIAARRGIKRFYGMSRLCILALLAMLAAGGPAGAVEEAILPANIIFVTSTGFWEESGDPLDMLDPTGKAGESEPDEAPSAAAQGQRGYYKLIAVRQPEGNAHIHLQQIALDEDGPKVISSAELDEFSEMKAYVTDIRPETSDGVVPPARPLCNRLSQDRPAGAGDGNLDRADRRYRRHQGRAGDELTIGLVAAARRAIIVHARGAR